MLPGSSYGHDAQWDWLGLVDGKQDGWSRND
jgi:hypothetical protein